MKPINTLLLTVILFLPAYAHAAEFEGLIEPHRVVKVGSPVPGILETVDVDRGDFVKKAQVLARLQSEVEKATM